MNSEERLKKIQKKNKKNPHIYNVNEDVMREVGRSEEKIRARKRKKLIIAGCIAAGIVLIGLLVWFILSLVKYSSYSVISETAEADAGDNFFVFEGGIVFYSENGMSYRASNDRVLWNHGYSMSIPKCVIGKNYCVIYDKGSNNVLLFNEDGVVASFLASSQIVCAGVSDYGVVALLTQDNLTSSVLFYDKTGRQLDIEVKNVLAQNSGYPLSMALSPSGVETVLSLLFVDKADMTGRISFLNFDEGKDNTDRVVGYFEYESNLFPELSFLSDDEVVAIGDGRIEFYSVSDSLSPSLEEEIVYEDEIKSVGCGSGSAFVIKTSSEGGYDLLIYDSDGDEKLNYNFDFEYTKAEISGDYVMVYGGETTLIAKLSGHVKFEGTFDGVLEKMSSVGLNKFIQVGDFGVRTIRLK